MKVAKGLVSKEKRESGTMSLVGTQDADVQPVTSPTVLNVAYQDVMLWNGALGNSTNGIINAGIDPDRLMTEGTPKGGKFTGILRYRDPSNCGNRCSSNRDFPA